MRIRGIRLLLAFSIGTIGYFIAYHFSGLPSSIVAIYFWLLRLFNRPQLTWEKEFELLLKIEEYTQWTGLVLMIMGAAIFVLPLLFEGIFKRVKKRFKGTKKQG